MPHAQRKETARFRESAIQGNVILHNALMNLIGIHAAARIDDGDEGFEEDDWQQETRVLVAFHNSLCELTDGGWIWAPILGQGAHPDRAAVCASAALSGPVRSGVRSPTILPFTVWQAPGTTLPPPYSNCQLPPRV